ncbi:hypothetical protein F5Y13DRAFT_189299 [Hypoxylon sp. FL1857]|nr:hypothetical protein F5Y13DRAFT_189299 [Hypoxylon sp. FL1857]
MASQILASRLSELYPISNSLNVAEDSIQRNYFRASQFVQNAQFACPPLRMGQAWRDIAPDGSVYKAMSVTFHVFDAVNNAEWPSKVTQSDYGIASPMPGSWVSFARFEQPTVPFIPDGGLGGSNLTFAKWTRAG